MNYLAHIFLAGQLPEAQLGGLLGDFVKPGSQEEAFDPVVAREIRIHRMIDSFTDSNPVVIAARARFRPHTRRFSGIVLDILYDHFLASAWSDYSGVDLRSFIDRFHACLQQPPMPLPERLDRLAPILIREDWLSSYLEYAGVENAVRRLSQRLSRGAEELVAGLDDASSNLTAFREGFRLFFPELQHYVVKERLALMSRSR